MGKILLTYKTICKFGSQSEANSVIVRSLAGPIKIQVKPS